MKVSKEYKDWLMMKHDDVSILFKSAEFESDINRAVLKDDRGFLCSVWNERAREFMSQYNEVTQNDNASV